MTSSKPIIGLCGGIGSGKSRVAAEFERLGCCVVDSDRLSHAALGEPASISKLRQWWGDDVVTADGRPNRARIAEIVFQDAAAKTKLEGLLYPLIAVQREDIIQKAIENPAVSAIILDSPLLFETSLDDLCDAVVFVHASEPHRIERLQQSRKWNVKQVRDRERWQMPLEQKRSRATFVIDNDGPEERLRPQVAEILKQVVSRHSFRR